MAWVMRFMTKKRRSFLAVQTRPKIEQGVPSDLPQEDCDKMLNDLLAMYSDPNAIMAYANDAVYKHKNFRIAADSNSQIRLKDKKYYVGAGKKRYLWLATCMGVPTVKDAPGIEIVQTYNLMNRK